MCYIVMMVRTKLASATSNLVSYKRIFGPLIPYITVGIGLFLLNNAWIAIVSYHLCMITILLLAKEKIPFTRIQSGRSYAIFITTTLLSGAGGILLYLLWPLLGIPSTINLYIQNIGLSTKTWPYFVVYFVLINGIVEECYWRVYLGSYSKKIIFNDLLFSGYHIMVLAGRINIIWLIIVFIALSLGAWFWRAANRWNGGILTSMISHIIADASVIITIYFMTSRI